MNIDEKRIKHFIFSNYILEVDTLIFLRESSDNILYKIVCVDKQNFILRISKRKNLFEQDINFELEVINVANTKNIKTSKILSNKSGKFISKFDDYFCVVFYFIDSVHIDNSAVVSPEYKKVYNAGIVLAELHKAWEGFVPESKKTRNIFFEYEKFFADKDFFLENFENGKTLFEITQEVFDFAKSKNNNQIIHNDFRCQNVFYEKDSDTVLAVIDFDWACQGNYLKDLAHSIVEWSLPDGLDKVRINLAQAFFDGYNSSRKIDINIEDLKKWMKFACISDALTYWFDRRDILKQKTKLCSYMLNKATKVDEGQFDDLLVESSIPFVYLEGLCNLSEKLEGNEKIHMGIRPYGFHAGNALTMTAYPKILCEEFRKRKNIEPNFEFIISINDWEQDALDGQDYIKYPFNIFPKETSIQMLSTEKNSSLNMVDYWQEVIEKCIQYALRDFHKVNVNFYRNSSLKNTTEFKNLLIETIKNPKRQYEIYKKYSGCEFLDSPISFAGAICPNCRSAHGFTNIKNTKVLWKCIKCGFATENEYSNFEYWWYHKILLIARIKLFKYDVLLSGGDHFSENDFMIRRALIKEFLPEIKIPKMFFGATLLSKKDGKRMSKSKGNTYFAYIDKILEIARKDFSKEILITDAVILNYNDDEYKKYCSSL